jgi:hypothetical protein
VQDKHVGDFVLRRQGASERSKRRGSSEDKGRRESCSSSRSVPKRCKSGPGVLESVAMVGSERGIR